MKLSINWLKTFIDYDLSTEELGDKLTNAGFEVESIDPMCSATNLVVGEVLECENHPDSDHLNVCKVNVGNEVLNIVCGANNVKKGIKVITALVGAKLPEIEIKQAKVRGVESSGMLCSLLELGIDKKQLSEEQISGIEILDDSCIVGANPLVYLGLDDVILDVSVTPNRADCNAFYDLVREVGAILEKPVKLPEITEVKGLETNLNIGSTTEKCPLFLGRIVKGVKIKESPLWIKNVLTAYGIKAINNVVDISNLVMLETGQPMHFYDLDCLEKAELVCADDYQGEYLALDGLTYNLVKGDLVIKCNDKVVGIAGIMGGDDSKITTDTTNILLESANFDLACIRLTSRRLNLTTEAATRFSKGISTYNTNYAISRAVQLLTEYADLEVVEELVEYGNNKQNDKVVELSVEKCNAVLNSNFTEKEIASVFTRLSFNYSVDSGNFKVEIPSYRMDLHLAEDLIEEVVRLLGYGSIGSKLPTMQTTIGKLAKNEDRRYMVKSILNGLGNTEIMTYSLIGQRLLDDACNPVGKPVELANPLSDERRYYRTSLLPSMLDVISYNQARFQANYSFFEIANVYSDEGLSQERLSLGISNSINLSKWQKIKFEADFFVLKGRIESVLTEFGFDLKRIFYKENDFDTTNFHPTRSALIYIDRELVGVFGRIHPKQMKKYDVDSCVIGELNLSAIYNLNPGKIKYKPISKYPSVKFDLSMIVKDEVTAKEIIDCITKATKSTSCEVEIFDIFKGGAIEKGSKSIAVSLTFQSNEKTLGESDIDPVISEVMSSLRSKLNANIRDK